MTAGQSPDPDPFPEAMPPKNDEQCVEGHKVHSRENAKQKIDPEIPPGATIYHRSTLFFYDFLVHGLSNRFVWRCPTRHLKKLYQEQLSANHLEIGIGSGRFLRSSARDCKFNRLAIADVNPECLAYASKILEPWRPQTLQLNLLDPLFASGHQANRFDSIGINYVLHCLATTWKNKLAICDSLVTNMLNPGGVLFGSTLFPGLNEHYLSRRLMKTYQRKRIFHNAEDDPTGFSQWAENRYPGSTFQQAGCAMLFIIRSNT